VEIASTSPAKRESSAKRLRAWNKAGRPEPKKWPANYLPEKFCQKKFEIFSGAV
jgi:hypothetical protein